MGLFVYVPLPSVQPPYVNWGGACGVYRGFAVYAYDTSRVRPGGSDNPGDKYYKYYPAEGAVVKARFYDPQSGWSYTVTKKIPTFQPKGEDIAWVEVGTTIPCDICKGRNSFYVSVDLTVIYKGQVWNKSYKDLIYVVCPKESQPSSYVIKIKSSDAFIDDGMVCAYMWLEECIDPEFSVPVGHYVNGRLVSQKVVRLYRNRKTKVCFSAMNGNNAIAVVKPGTNVVGSDYACGKGWEIRL